MFFKKLVFFFLFFVAGIYIYYLYKYPVPYYKSNLFEYYEEDIIIRRGAYFSFPQNRIQHFKNFPAVKDKDTIRIGIFGDSHTYGNEVEKTETYPYQLQRMFVEKAPHLKIEVLNFGVNSDSLQGQFFMWDAYRKRYQLDYIVLGPRLYLERDSTFRENFNMLRLRYPKNRFILEKDGVSIKEVFIHSGREKKAEDILKKRHKSYYRLIPTWTALRYDKKPFQIWEFLFPFLKHKLSNPFYYTNLSEHEEIPHINKFLLEKMRKEYDKKILFFTDHSYTFNSYKLVKEKYNLNEISRLRQKIYYIFSHGSSLRNEYNAKVYFNALIGKKSFSLNRIKCFFLEKEKEKEKEKVKKASNFDLSVVKSIQIVERNNLLSVLNKNAYKKRQIKIIKNTLNFISFSNKADFLGSLFFSIKFPLKETEKLYLKLKNRKFIELGEIKALDSHHKFFTFYADYIQNERLSPYYNTYKTYFQIKHLPLKLKEELEHIEYPIDLLIGQNEIGKIYPGYYEGEKVFFFFSEKQSEESFLMMGPSSGLVREKDFKDEFFPEMLYIMEDGTRVRSSIFGWECKKVKDKVQLELPNFEPIELD